jgi:putative transposase
MSQYIRRKYAGGYFFFTVVTHNRQPIFNNTLARSILKSTWVQVQEKYPFRVIALCLLPEHIHCLLRLPEDDNNYSIRWSAIKAGFTKNY